MGASPTRRPLQPEATGAGMEETKCPRVSSSKLRPSPSSLASKPVKACHRFTAHTPERSRWRGRRDRSARRRLSSYPSRRMGRKQPGPVTSCSQLGGACTRRAFVCRGRSRTSSSCRCPTRGLLMIAGPLARHALAHRVPARLVLAVIMAEADRKVVFAQTICARVSKPQASRLACTIPALIPACQT